MAHLLTHWANDLSPTFWHIDRFFEKFSDSMGLYLKVMFHPYLLPNDSPIERKQKPPSEAQIQGGNKEGVRYKSLFNIFIGMIALFL